jgi:hypothetical protein
MLVELEYALLLDHSSFTHAGAFFNADAMI